MKKGIFAILILALLLLSIVYAQGNFVDKPLPEDKADQILLKSRQITADKGISQQLKNKIEIRAPENTHVLLQFDNIPSSQEQEELKNQGIELIAYIPNRAWFASVPSDFPSKTFPNIRAAIEIIKEDKISNAVKNNNYRINDDNTVNLSIKFFDDVDLDSAASIIENHGRVIDKFYFVNIVKLVTEETLISDIANEENVQWIDVIDKTLQTHNDGNRLNIGVDTLQVSPYSLSGSGIATAEWDSGWADINHDDLQGRVTLGDNTTCGAGDSGTCGTATHSTHVAGTMLGNGTLSQTEGGTALQWRGMAPKATVISYEWWDSSTELNDEHDDAINTYGAVLSQNSWGYTYTGCGADCSGGYDSFAGELDSIVRGSKGKKISQIWSAGNNRPADCDSGIYDCIGFPGTAKNAITIGATNSNDDSMTSFSSFGPTNDGRLKPEVTAPGCQSDGDTGVTSTFPNDVYGVFCGTSMAAPTTSGVVALMYKEYGNNGIFPLPSTIKAILIHTSVDLGNTGPDYSFGYGRIDAVAAIDKIKEDSDTTDVVEEEIISDSEILEFDMTVASTVKVTLVWDDPAAAANADPTLVNDLDLVLVAPNGTSYRPWVLDPVNPADIATTGTNTIDNVEQVFVENALSGIWTVKVTGSSVPTGPQNFSLISDHSFSIKPSITVKTFRDSYVTEDKFFDNGENVFIQANVTAGNDPVAGSTVTAVILSNNVIEDTLTLNEVSNGIYRNSWDSTAHTNDVYLINVTATGNGTANGNSSFHLYSGSGVSAYLLDFDEDGEDDKVLENKHIVSVFKRELNKSPILYYEQKDTNVSYSFLDSPYENATSRGGISTDEFSVTLNFSFCPIGEDLSDAFISMELLKVNAGGADPSLDSSSQACGTDCNECTNNDACATPTCKEKGGAKAYIDDIRIDATVVEPNSDITVTIDTVQSFTSDCSAIYYKAPGDSFQEVFCKCPAQFASETHSVTFDVGSSSGTGTIRATMNDGGSSCVVCSTSNGENDKMEITIASVTEESFDFLADVNISLDTEDVDYLVYTLRNFNETAFPDSIFSDIYGTIGSSVDDDRYHLQTGEDALITSLPADQWNNFNSNFSLVYDNSTAADSVNENVLAFVRFNESAGTSFQDVGLWHGSEGLRIRYNVTEAATNDVIKYILTFTKGDWQTIDQWMSTIAGKEFPSTNFLTAPVVTGKFISITLIGFPIEFGAVDPNIDFVPALGNANSLYIIRVEPETNVSVDLFQKGLDFTGTEDVIRIGNVSSAIINATVNSTPIQTVYNATNPLATNLTANTNTTVYYWINIPNPRAGDYNSTISIKAEETGTEEATTTREFNVTVFSFGFDPSSISVNEGDTVRLNINNTASARHTFNIDEFNVHTGDLPTGVVITEEFVANQTGTFFYYCDVGNHRQQGMEGNLTVNP